MWSYQLPNSVQKSKSISVWYQMRSIERVSSENPKTWLIDWAPRNLGKVSICCSQEVKLVLARCEWFTSHWPLQHYTELYPYMQWIWVWLWLNSRAILDVDMRTRSKCLYQELNHGLLTVTLLSYHPEDFPDVWIHIVACRPIARQQLWEKQLYNSCC
jgi:hypothetical protein